MLTFSSQNAPRRNCSMVLGEVENSRASSGLDPAGEIFD